MTKGFTLLETLLVIALMIILAALALPAFFNFQKNAELQNFTAEVLSDLRLSHGRALSSEENSRWGIYFDTASSPNQYIIFKGESFALRDIDFDEIHHLSKNLEFSDITLADNQVVFNTINGLGNNSGLIKLSLVDNPLKYQTIYLASSGLAGLNNEIPSDDDRLKDSRHIHFFYNRAIDTLTEDIIITFPDNGPIIETIPIVDCLSGSAFDWSGEIEVAGETQVIKIHTHYLNDPIIGSATLFCVHRDGRYNNKAMRIDISGDPSYPGLSPTLIEYSVDGSTTLGNSVFVNNLLWQ